MPPTTGMLILHGFTGSRATVAPLIPVAEVLGMPWSLPQLRGHWTSPDDLHGVTYQDLLADALAAFDKLRAEVDQVAVVGLSVGGKIALDLATRRNIVALAVIAPALRYANPLTRFAPLIAKVQKEFAGGNPHGGFSDPSYGEGIGNYDRFPTATFLSILRAAPGIQKRLPQIIVPTLVIGARNDKVVLPIASQIVYDGLGARDKQLVWFDRSGHEMLVDCEGPQVCERVEAFLRRVVGLGIQESEFSKANEFLPSSEDVGGTQNGNILNSDS